MSEVALAGVFGGSSCKGIQGVRRVRAGPFTHQDEVSAQLEVEVRLVHHIVTLGPHQPKQELVKQPVAPPT